jgi:hypothetical protein
MEEPTGAEDFVITCSRTRPRRFVSGGRDLTSSIGVGKLSFDPGLDFAPPVSDVSSNAKAIGSFPAVSPLVERGDRYAEIFGELLDGEKPVALFHPVDHAEHPVGWLPIVSTVGSKGFSTDDDTLLTGFSTLC